MVSFTLKFLFNTTPLSIIFFHSLVPYFRSSIVPASFRCPHTSINHFHAGTTKTPSPVPYSS